MRELRADESRGVWRHTVQRRRPITATTTITAWVLVLAMAAVATVHAKQFPQNIPIECAGNPAC